MIKCLNPITTNKIKNLQKTPTYKKTQLIRCGKCSICLGIKAYNNYNKLIEYNKQEKIRKGYMLTLTYRNNKIKYVDKTHIQKFIKKLRKYYNKYKISYICIGEYGEITHRPHYHILIWMEEITGIKITYRIYNKILDKIWNYGMVDILEIQDNMIKYMSSHKLKIGKIKQHKEICGIKLITKNYFVLQSKDLGKPIANKEIYQYIKNGWYPTNPTTQYYIKKYKLTHKPTEKEKIRGNNNYYNNNTINQATEIIKKSKHQKEYKEYIENKKIQEKISKKLKNNTFL